MHASMCMWRENYKNYLLCPSKLCINNMITYIQPHDNLCSTRVITFDPKKISSKYTNMGSSFEGLVVTNLLWENSFSIGQWFELQNILNFRIGKNLWWHHQFLFLGFGSWTMVFLIVHLLLTSARFLPIVCVSLWSQNLDFIHKASTLRTLESIPTNRIGMSWWDSWELQSFVKKQQLSTGQCKCGWSFEVMAYLCTAS